MKDDKHTTAITLLASTKRWGGRWKMFTLSCASQSHVLEYDLVDVVKKLRRTRI